MDWNQEVDGSTGDGTTDRGPRKDQQASLSPRRRGQHGNAKLMCMLVDELGLVFLLLLIMTTYQKLFVLRFNI
jgi:hypothetical protein